MWLHIEKTGMLVLFPSNNRIEVPSIIDFNVTSSNKEIQGGIIDRDGFYEKWRITCYIVHVDTNFVKGKYMGSNKNLGSSHTIG